MVSVDPKISNLLRVYVSSEASSGPGCASTFSNVPKEKWKTLDIQNGSKDRINNSIFFSGSMHNLTWCTLVNQSINGYAKVHHVQTNSSALDVLQLLWLLQIIIMLRKTFKQTSIIGKSLTDSADWKNGFERKNGTQTRKNHHQRNLGGHDCNRHVFGKYSWLPL